MGDDDDDVIIIVIQQTTNFADDLWEMLIISFSFVMGWIGLDCLTKKVGKGRSTLTGL
jgi:TctA family transporter